MPRKPVIAIVDDDESMREALTGLIRSLGYVALAFASAENFLKSARRRRLACVISDIQMPGMSGPKLYDRLAASNRPIPTILITAYPDDRLRQRVLEAGVTCYLVKPFSEDDLLACINSVLKPHDEA